MLRWREWILVPLLALTVLAPNAFPTPVYPNSDDPPLPVPPGTSLQMWADWQGPLTDAAVNKPDRSFRSIWVRIFPLISNPLGDPYPNTADYAHISAINETGFHLYELNSDRLIAAGKSMDADFGAQNLRIDGKAYPLQPYWLVPDDASTTSVLTWDRGSVRAQMRGGFIIKKSVHVPRDNPVARELWSVINVVTVNEYLQSVVPSEVISKWSPETLKAQAIAARTYGLYEVAQARAQGQDFDLDPSTWYQSYQGVLFWNRSTGKWRQVELPATTKAVTSTKGEVLLYQNEVIKAYFSANSGGRTCLVKECLELDAAPGYIQEINDHPQIRSAPGGTWGSRADLTAESIRNVLLSLGLSPPGPVKRLEALEKGPSGRTWRLRVLWEDGTGLELDRLQTRKIMHLFGPIRSFLYKLGKVGSNGKQNIVGHGYGHAVGMSQWGAQLYAKQGWDAHKILRHYYKDVVIKDLGTNE